MGLSLKDNQHLGRLFLRIIGAATLAITLLAALVGWFMARRALRGLSEVTGTACAIARGALSSRAPENPGDQEVERLSSTFNRMADRIQALLRQMVEMTDNIARELRSPVTRIRDAAEVPVATGGRYDALTRQLGQGAEIPAVGAVLRPGLMLELREMAQ